MYVVSAIKNGRIDIAEYVLPTLFQTKFKGHEKLLFDMFEACIGGDNLDNIKLFIKMGALKMIEGAELYDIMPIVYPSDRIFDYLIETEKKLFTADLLKKIHKHGAVNDHKMKSIERRLAQIGDNITYSLKEKLSLLSNIYHDAKKRAIH